MAADVNKPVDQPVATNDSSAETSRQLFADVDFGKMPQKDGNKPESPAAATSTDTQSPEKAVADHTKQEGGDGTVSAVKAAEIAKKEGEKGNKEGAEANKDLSEAEKTGEMTFPKIDGYDNAKGDKTGKSGESMLDAKLEQGTKGGDGQAQLDQALQRMRDGGLLKDAKGGDGNLTTEELRAGKFDTNADKFTDKTSKKEFGNQVRSVLERQDIDAATKAEILNSGQNIIEQKDFGDRGMKSQANRELLTTTMFENLGKNWNSNSQGDNGTCALTEIGTAQNYLNPAKVARDTENIVKDGVWNTDSKKDIYIHDSFMSPDAEASKGLDKDANGVDLGNRNFHTQLMNGKDGSYLNQEQGKLYTNGTAEDGYTEALWERGKDADGKSTWNLVSKGSPDVQPSEAADMAKSDDYGIADKVTVAVNKSDWASAGSKNLTDSKNLDSVVKDIEAGNKGDKHYLIMLGAGGDKLLQNGRDVNAGAHSGHAYGAAFSKTGNINDRVDGEQKGGEWKAKNTWTDATTESMDRTLVGADGKMNVGAAQRSMDMSIDRTGQPLGGTGSYREWSDNHPGGRSGVDPKLEDELKKDKKKRRKKSGLSRTAITTRIAKLNTTARKVLAPRAKFRICVISKTPPDKEPRQQQAAKRYLTLAPQLHSMGA